MFKAAREGSRDSSLSFEIEFAEYHAEHVARYLGADDPFQKLQ